jgi:hypothetical protein
MWWCIRTITPICRGTRFEQFPGRDINVEVSEVRGRNIAGGLPVLRQLPGELQAPAEWRLVAANFAAARLPALSHSPRGGAVDAPF